MARGRKPKPIELREAEGNLGNRPLPPALKTSALEMEPPPLLAEAGKQLWEEMTRRLGSVGALDEADRAALTAMCLQWDRAADAARVLAQQGHYAQGSMGQLVAHPAVAIERAAHAAFLKFAAEFASTPVARARVATAQHQHAAAKEFEEIVDAEPIEIEGPTEIDGDVL